MYVMGEGVRRDRAVVGVCEEAGDGMCEVGGVVGYLVCCEWEGVEVGRGGSAGGKRNKVLGWGCAAKGIVRKCDG